MAISPLSPLEWGGLSMEGGSSYLLLPARIASSKLRELGTDLPPNLIVEAFEKNLPSRSLRVPASLKKMIPGRTADFFAFGFGLQLSICLFPRWKLEISVGGAHQSTIIQVFVSSDGGWVLQDLPSGSPAETITSPSVNFGDGGEVENTYVLSERNFFQGKLWNRLRESPADLAYYDHGGLRWTMKYTNGEPQTSRSSPWCKFFWPSGSVMMEEYGSAKTGRHRPVQAGPAYQEYYPDGNIALSIFSENGQIVGTGKWFDERGNQVNPRSLVEPVLDCVRLTNVEDPFAIIESFDLRHGESEKPVIS